MPRKGAGHSTNSTRHRLRRRVRDIRPNSCLSAQDPISAFFNTFAARLSGDGDLSSQWARVQSGAQGLANAGSAANFIKQGLAELLRLVALLLDSALAVEQCIRGRAAGHRLAT